MRVRATVVALAILVVISAIAAICQTLYGTAVAVTSMPADNAPHEEDATPSSPSVAVSVVVAEHTKEPEPKANKTEAPPPEVHRFIYWKTAKTASSTLANIFNAHALKYGLRVVKPADGVYLTRKADFVVHRQLMKSSGKPFDIACNHMADWDLRSPAWLEELVPGAPIVTSLRDPASRLLSGIVFDTDRYDVPLRKDAIAMLERDLLSGRIGKKSLHPLRLPHHDDRRVLDKKLEFVFIVERLLESLILFGHRYGWPLEDLVFLGFKESMHKLGLADLSEKAQAVIRSFVKAPEQELYDKWRAETERQWRAAPASWREEELPRFKQMLADFTDKCKASQALKFHSCKTATTTLKSATQCSLAKTDSNPLSRLMRCKQLA
jgi:hypothetical protein